MGKLDGIDVFVEVVDAQSFTKAAQRLQMPPATVSAKIARLEEKLGVTLIQRTTRRLHVTAEGRAYYEHCVKALVEMSEAHRRLVESSAEPTGKLRITAPADVAHIVLPDLIDTYLTMYPKVSIDLVITNRLVDLVAEGIDLAVRVGQLEDSTLTVRKFLDVRAGLWASRSYAAQHGLPKRPTDLAKHFFISFSKIPKDMRLRSGRRSFALDLPARIVTDDMEIIRTFVRRGRGIGFLPEFVGKSGRNADDFVRVLPEYVSEIRHFHLAYPAQKFVPPPVRAFIALASRTVKLTRC